MTIRRFKTQVAAAAVFLAGVIVVSMAAAFLFGPPRGWVFVALAGGGVGFAACLAYRFAGRLLGALRGLLVEVRSVVTHEYQPQEVSVPEVEVNDLVQSLRGSIRTLHEREKLRSAVDRIMPREVAEELLRGDMPPGGEVRFATVLFCDIRDFSTLAESMEPHDMVNFLNETLALITEQVEKNQGMVDKFIGDSVMAVFGAPVTHDADVDHALQAAEDILKSLKDLNYRRAWLGQPSVRVGIGMNTGPVIAGNVGAGGRLNYTVLGDSVNLASRLEGLTRLYGVNCLISEFTHHECKRGYVFRELDLVRVKGRSRAVRLFELWVNGRERQTINEIFIKFQNARQFYLLRDWDRAETLFRQVLELQADDGPSLLYLKRLSKLRKNPPPNDWDGVFTATVKG